MEHKTYNNIVMLETCGLKCDNPKCDWQDHTVKFDDLEKLVNARCPKCGQNVLTEKDYENAIVARAIADYINTVSPEQLVEQAKQLDPDGTKQAALMDSIKGGELLKSDEMVIVSLETHNEISIKEIKPITIELPKPTKQIKDADG